MNGKQIWSFNDTSPLPEPRGVVVDNDGFVFVTGKQSGKIVVISPDGNSAKEVYQISCPRAICYTTTYGFCVRYVKQFISVTRNM
jgi:DNA-binding beta-propeller fold protein YncE